MHDELAMRICRGIADCDDQAQTRLKIERMPLAIFRQRQTIDIAHREPWATMVVDAAVDQRSDAWVVESRENATLREEAQHRAVAGEFTAYDFQCDVLLVLTIVARGQEHAAHAAAADLAQDSPGAQARWQLITQVIEPAAPVGDIGCDISLGSIERKQTLEASAQVGRFAPSVVEQSLPSSRIGVDDALEQHKQARPRGIRSIHVAS